VERTAFRPVLILSVLVEPVFAADGSLLRYPGFEEPRPRPVEEF